MATSSTPPIPQDKIGESFVWRDWFQKLSDRVFGTLASQDSHNVNITGGTITGVNLSGLPIVNTTIDNTPIGSFAPATGAFTTLSLTSPLAVAYGGTGNSVANANYVFAGPSSGSSAAPSFRPLVVADIPSLPYGTGTVTGIVAGPGLSIIGGSSGGTISTFGTLYVADTGVSATTYGSSTKTNVITLNSRGQVTNISANDIGIPATSIISGTIATGRISGSYTSLTGVGTLTAGTWNANTIDVAHGGTGATTFTAGYLKGSGTTALTTVTSIPSTDVSGLGTMATQSASSVAITGGTITGLSSPLPVGSGGTGATGFTAGYVKGNGTSAFSAVPSIPNTDISGLGSMSTQSASSVTISGGTITGLFVPLPVTSGGIGVQTITGYVKGNGTSAMTGSSTIPTSDLSGTITNAQLANNSVTINGSAVSLGGSATVTATATNALTIGTGLSGTSYNGSAAVSIANTGVLSVSGGSTGLTPSTATTGAVTLGGTLVVANGGTGLTTLATGYIPYGNGTGAFASNSGLNYSTTNTTLTAPVLATTSTTSTTPSLTFNASNSGFAAGASVPNSYLQTLLQNSSSTANASTNYVLSNDLGTDSTYYGEFGMNSSVYSGASVPADFFSINNGVYFSGHDGDVTIGSGNGKKLYLAWGTAGGSAHVINASGAIGLNTNLAAGTGSGTTNFGTSGQVLTSAGNAATPTWTTPAGGTVTSVSGTGTVNGLTLTGTVTSTGSLTLGGTLNLASPPAIGGTTPSTGSFTTITSTVATGTAPLTVTSTTNVANLNASSLNGATFASPGAIGSTTASTGAFTTLSASSTVNLSGGTVNGVAYLDASKNLVTGTAIGFDGTNLFLAQTSTGYKNSNSSYCGTGNHFFSHASGTATGTVYVGFGYNAAQIGSITQSGTTAVLYNVTSDARLKYNIQDAESASTLIDSIQVRQYEWVVDNTPQRYGFIAQELVQVVPEAVYQPEDTNDMMAVDYSKLVPLLVKEVQELRRRVATLEGRT